MAGHLKRKIPITRLLRLGSTTQDNDRFCQLDLGSVLRSSLLHINLLARSGIVMRHRLFHPAGHICDVGILARVERPAQMLRSEEREQNDVRVDAAHENADDGAVVVSLGARGRRRKRESLADGRFNRRTRRRNQVAQLVSSTDDKGPEGTRGQFHQVDGNDSPRTLHTELLEESGRNDTVVGHEGIRIEQCATDDANADDTNPTAEDLRAISNHSATGHGAEVGYNLGDGDIGCAKLVLVGEHGRIEIL